MIALTDTPNSIGDLLMWSSLPENYFKTFNEYLIDLESKWTFDFNPFIKRFPLNVTEAWQCNKMLAEYGIKNPNEKHKSITEGITKAFGCNMFQRKPRLYQYEDIIQEPKTLVLHTTGKSIRGGLSFETCEAIAKNYKDYKIIQVGGERDSCHGYLFSHYENKLNLPIWDTIKIIASSEIFIGVNSGMMHIANCYDRVVKKIILFELNEEQLNNFVPGLQNDVPNGVWVDVGMQYYNSLQKDVGLTRSINYI